MDTSNIILLVVGIFGAAFMGYLLRWALEDKPLYHRRSKLEHKANKDKIES